MCIAYIPVLSTKYSFFFGEDKGLDCKLVSSKRKLFPEVAAISGMRLDEMDGKVPWIYSLNHLD